MNAPDLRALELNLQRAAIEPNETVRAAALLRQTQLTKPGGSLGRLEALAVQLASLQGSPTPCADALSITIFAADHGVAAQGVSAFPQSVTAAMVANFAAGGAAISVLAQTLNASLEVINLGTVEQPAGQSNIVNLELGQGTADFTQTAAMTREQLQGALQAGTDAVDRVAANTQVFIAGEMGIANTTSATAIAAALLQRSPTALAGPGTGLNQEGIEHKAAVIQQALTLHGASSLPPLELMRCLGGFEIAALGAAYIRCAQRGMPVLVDGFICSVAALWALTINPGIKPWLILSHQSAEPGHRHIINAIGLEPLLNLGMRLGEGSGAAVAMPLLRLACSLHNEMATFEQAQVSDRDDS